MLFQLNRSKWTHFTEQNCSAETAVSIELQVTSTIFGNYFVQTKLNNIKAILFLHNSGNAFTKTFQHKILEEKNFCKFSVNDRNKNPILKGQTNLHNLALYCYLFSKSM